MIQQIQQKRLSLNGRVVEVLDESEGTDVTVTKVYSQTDLDDIKELYDEYQRGWGTIPPLQIIPSTTLTEIGWHLIESSRHLQQKCRVQQEWMTGRLDNLHQEMGYLREDMRTVKSMATSYNNKLAGRPYQRYIESQKQDGTTEVIDTGEPYPSEQIPPYSETFWRGCGQCWGDIFSCTLYPFIKLGELLWKGITAIFCWNKPNNTRRIEEVD